MSLLPLFFWDIYYDASINPSFFIIIYNCLVRALTSCMPNTKYLTFGMPNTKKYLTLNILNVKNFSMAEQYCSKIGMVQMKC